MTQDFVTNQEVIQAAHRNMDAGAWDYLAGGSESETTLRRKADAPGQPPDTCTVETRFS